jgi:hypothetical protein
MITDALPIKECNHQFEVSDKINKPRILDVQSYVSMPLIQALTKVIMGNGTH